MKNTLVTPPMRILHYRPAEIINAGMYNDTFHKG